MGRGPRDSDDPPMRRPVDLTENQGGDSATVEETSYCSTRREFEFVGDPSREALSGAPIRLRLGDPVEVVGTDGRLGTLEAIEGSSMRSCLMMGYRMTGSIIAFDPDLGRGTVSVVGTQEDAVP
jgi:hypothetical protein